MTDEAAAADMAARFERLATAWLNARKEAQHV
jgi:myo-inositol catabolism protein IolC